MTLTLSSSTPTEPRQRLPRRRWMLWTLIGLALTAGASFGLVAVTRTSPHYAHSLVGVGASTGGTVTVGKTIYTLPVVDLDSTRPERLDLRAVRPDITVDSAHATVRVLTCTRNDAPLSNLGSQPDWCASTAPFVAGARTLAGDPSQSGLTVIILAITPHHTGTIRISGVRVDYRDRARSASQTTGVDLDLTARAPG